MLRVPISHAIKSARRAGALSESASLYDGRAMLASSWILDKNVRKYGDGDSSGASAMMALAALAAAGIGVHVSSPAQAEAADAEGAAKRTHSNEGAPRISKESAPPVPTAGHFAWKPFGSSGAATRDLENAVKSAASGKKKKESSEGGEKRGDTAPDEEGGSDKGDGDKLGLRLSAMSVREALKGFRNQRASMRVLCPPIDFREEQVRAAASPGGATMSASFYVPRSANILRVLSAMISPDQTFEVKQPALDKTEASIAFCEKDRTGSLLVRQEPPPGRMGCRDSIHLYRDGGFTKRDLDVLVQGYQEAWSGAAGQDVSYRYVFAASLGFALHNVRRGVLVFVWC